MPEMGCSGVKVWSRQARYLSVNTVHWKVIMGCCWRGQMCFVDMLEADGKDQKCVLTILTEKGSYYN